MKYLLKQNKEDKGILCDKVTIDGFDYYVDYSQPIEVGKWYISNQAPRLCVKIKEGKYPYIHLNNKGEEIADFYTWKGVIICSNNPNIDIPKVVDEVEKLATLHKVNISEDWSSVSFIVGYSKSQETHPFSEEDLKSLLDFITNEKSEYSIMYGNQTERFSTEDKDYSIEQLIKIWKEQQPKIVYYNE